MMHPGVLVCFGRSLFAVLRVPDELDGAALGQMLDARSPYFNRSEAMRLTAAGART